jgi:alkanesulfonate monooxygenase SsuD/methylene tetrahydromethanopterin reductase-like flavin-dependent oxidoreductase (luciferase family)
VTLNRAVAVAKVGAVAALSIIEPLSEPLSCYDGARGAMPTQVGTPSRRARRLTVRSRSRARQRKRRISAGRWICCRPTAEAAWHRVMRVSTRSGVTDCGSRANPFKHRMRTWRSVSRRSERTAEGPGALIT